MRGWTEPVKEITQSAREGLMLVVPALSFWLLWSDARGVNLLLVDSSSEALSVK